MRYNIAYIRTSTKDQTPEIQLNDIKESFDKIQFRIVQERQSAYKENVKRIEFEKVIEQIKKNKVGNLVVWDLDRLYRNRIKLKDFFVLCKHHGTKVHSANQEWLNTINTIQEPFNDIMFDMLVQVFGWIGEEESLKRSNRVKMAVIKKEGQRTKSYKGKYWGRKPFPKQTINRVLELHTQGMSIREIADHIVVYDKNRNGRQISKSSVHKILSQIHT